jgi:hypothetical protein
MGLAPTSDPARDVVTETVERNELRRRREPGDVVGRFDAAELAAHHSDGDLIVIQLFTDVNELVSYAGDEQQERRPVRVSGLDKAAAGDTFRDAGREHPASARPAAPSSVYISTD